MAAAAGPADLAWGAFSESPPWVVDRAALTWLPEVPALRVAADAEGSALTTPTRWPPGARVVRVLGRLGFALAPWAARKRRHRYPSPEVSRADLSRRLRLAAESLGSTYIKLGQIISSGEGLFPPELVEEFKLCRDQVTPESFAVVREVVEADLGTTLEGAFDVVRPDPARRGVDRPGPCRRAAHRRARRRQGPAPAGRRPRTQGPAGHGLAGPAPRRSYSHRRAGQPAGPRGAVRRDHRRGARLPARGREHAGHRRRAGRPRPAWLCRPRPHPSLVTRRVLVMERLSGFKFDDVAGMHDAGIDTEEVVRTGMIAFMEGAMIHGIFHGDLHGGNLFVLPDGRTALLDFGIVGRLDDARRTAFLRLMLGATTNDVKGQLAALRDLGALPADTDLARGHQGPTPRPACGRPDDPERGGVREGGPAGGQGAAGLRRPHAQGADALRQEHGVPRRRHRPPGPRPRHPGRDRQHLAPLRPGPRRAAGPASSASTTPGWRSTWTASRPASAWTPRRSG